MEIQKKSCQYLKMLKKLVYLQGNYFQQSNVIIRNNHNVINIYVVYELDTITSSRDTTFTIKNALFGAMQITKNTDTSKYDHKEYGICFDKGGQFGHTITEGNLAHTTNARNVLISGVDMSFNVHALTEQIIFTLWVKNLYKVLMILQFMQKRAFIETLQKFMLSLN